MKKHSEKSEPKKMEKSEPKKMREAMEKFPKKMPAYKQIAKKK